eukprot:TRINITY_DN22410_c0_g1_i1.p1 TRINITY_DN22410_c0_g1~~TRINITY_DN22410_c0_g1_i1.p1  ORF type:complete len:187 (+),score=32.08 TRINITY_DN22410_c0_g1_i1:105-665(+)
MPRVADSSADRLASSSPSPTRTRSRALVRASSLPTVSRTPPSRSRESAPGATAGPCFGREISSVSNSKARSLSRPSSTGSITGSPQARSALRRERSTSEVRKHVRWADLECQEAIWARQRQSNAGARRQLLFSPSLLTLKQQQGGDHPPACLGIHAAAVTQKHGTDSGMTALVETLRRLADALPDM